jgi:hypothetical protein
MSASQSTVVPIGSGTSQVVGGVGVGVDVDVGVGRAELWGTHLAAPTLTRPRRLAIKGKVVWGSILKYIHSR